MDVFLTLTSSSIWNVSFQTLWVKFLYSSVASAVADHAGTSEFKHGG